MNPLGEILFFFFIILLLVFIHTYSGQSALSAPSTMIASVLDTCAPLAVSVYFHSLSTELYVVTPHETGQYSSLMN